MAENDDNKPTQSVSIEEYNKLKDDFTAQSAKLDKLEKIFEERQTKTLDKEGILKVLGLEKAPEKPIADVLSEKFSTLNATVEQLQADIKAKDDKIALNDKKQKVRELANSYNFIDVNDVLGVIDYSNEDIEGQLKTIAEIKKHWIKSTYQGSSFAGGQGTAANELEAQLRDAQKAGNAELAISLKRQLYERQK